jgi:serine/threonine-protein kinase
MLALQLNFIDRDALIVAMHAWILAKQQSLGTILIGQGRLTKQQHQALELLLEQHLQIYDNDPQRSLQALSTATPVAPLPADATPEDFAASLCEQQTLSMPLQASAEESEPNRFRKLRLHAHGGIGEVFVAEDAQLHREVALKEIQPARADEAASRARFVLEAEVTGRLEHPGIVPVYGLGLHADGRPYYAMRLIRGETLQKLVTRFHNRKEASSATGVENPAFRKLLRSFIDACNAVAYAHSRGVLHRDLKPSNIMVGKFGETLVVDWGLAKAGLGQLPHGQLGHEVTLDPPLLPSSGSSDYETRAGSALGTIGFMAPEQAAGRLDEMGPRSDIYSLGATLYVLLTGNRPFAGLDNNEVLRRTQLGAFDSPRQQSPKVSPALEAICLTAMALLPDNRYSSAQELAADVERWLADEPVTAFPEPWALRAARWGKRHQTGLVAAGVLLVSSVAALAVTTGLVYRAERQTARQEEIARENFELARDEIFDGFTLVEALEASFAGTPRLHKARKDFLVKAARAFHQYVDLHPQDLSLASRAAQVYRYTANVHRLGNEVDQAATLYQDSALLLTMLAEATPDDRDFRLRLSHVLRDHAKLLSNQGKLKDSIHSLTRAIEILGTNRQPDSSDRNIDRLLAAALLNRSTVEFELGEYENSKSSASQSVTLYRGLVDGPGQKIPYEPLFLAAAVDHVSSALRESGKLEEAIAGHQQAIDLVKPMLNPTPPGVVASDVLNFYSGFRMEQAKSLLRANKLAESFTAADFAVRQMTSLAKSNPQSPGFQEALANAHQQRAHVHLAKRALPEALADFQKSAELLDSMVAQAPLLPGLKGELGRAYLGLSRCALEKQDPAEADKWRSKAIHVLEQANGQSDEFVDNRQSLEQARRPANSAAN